MTAITIDNLSYDLDTLSTEAIEQILSIQFEDQELAQLQVKTAAFQTSLIA